MIKKYKTIIFFMIAVALLYFARDKYSSFNLSKTIQACMMGQKKLNPQMNADEIEKICVEYVKSQVDK